MPQRLRTKLGVVVLLLSACAAEVHGKQVSRSEAGGARAAESGKESSRRQSSPVCVKGEMSVPHSASDPCPQHDPTCLAAGGTAFAECEGGNWAKACFCIVPPNSPTTPAVCGDGLIEPIEQCDGTELNQATCLSLGFKGGGVLRCNLTTCLYDTQMCKS